jgi:dihydropyrimidine dehydrogenase (NAD+) subunit PreA
MELLKVNFLGFNLINPFVLASAPPTKDYDTIKKAFELGWAGIITKSIVIDGLRDKTPRIGHLKYKNRILATQNFEMGTEHSVSQWMEWVKQLRQEYPDRLIYVSLFASSNIDDWKTLASSCLNTGIQGLELNFSCPHSDHNGKGSVIGQNEELCAEITSEVKKIVGNELKIMPKLPYLVHPNESHICKLLVESGADAFAAINSIAGLCEFDIYNMEPKLNVGGKTTAGGITYDLIRPFGRLIVANIANAVDPNKYPISATGGVSRKIESMIEYFSLGANHLQVCSEAMNYGLEVIDDMKKNLTSYLNETGKTLDEIRGCALPKVVAWDKLDKTTRTAQIIEENCTKCYDCTTFCMYNAISVTKGSVPKIDANACEGCGSCLAACSKDSIVLNDLSLKI